MSEPATPVPTPPPLTVQIPLHDRKGAVVGHATVDNDTHLLIKLRKHPWFLVHGYAARPHYAPHHTTVYMHQDVYEHVHGSVPDKPLQIDHKNRKPLDNTRDNLRAVSRTIQVLNRGRRRDNTSGYTCVFWNKVTKSYQARVKLHRKPVSLGYYADPREAARRVNAFYRDNFPEVPIPNPHANVPPAQPPKVILNAKANQPASELTNQCTSNGG